MVNALQGLRGSNQLCGGERPCAVGHLHLGVKDAQFRVPDKELDYGRRGAEARQERQGRARRARNQFAQDGRRLERNFQRREGPIPACREERTGCFERVPRLHQLLAGCTKQSRAKLAKHLHTRPHVRRAHVSLHVNKHPVVFTAR